MARQPALRDTPTDIGSSQVDDDPTPENKPQTAPRDVAWDDACYHRVQHTRPDTSSQLHQIVPGSVRRPCGGDSEGAQNENRHVRAGQVLRAHPSGHLAETLHPQKHRALQDSPPHLAQNAGLHVVVRRRVTRENDAGSSVDCLGGGLGALPACWVV
eukprot:1179755-Prorocentrum_minimum.AAC.2